MKDREVPERLLHFIWENKQFKFGDLKTTDGWPVQVLYVGRIHEDAGPDFQHARLIIAGTQWAGHVEIHVRASDWYAHKHQFDPAYDSVILHVVWEEDRKVYRTNGQAIPCLELRNRVDGQVLRRYHSWKSNEGRLACSALFGSVNMLQKGLWLDHLLVERFQLRVAYLKKRLQGLRGDWEQLFTEQLFRGFGLRVNAEPMEMLARIAPLRMLEKYRHAPLQIEAMLFGQAGLLPEFPSNPYELDLVDQFAFLKRKHKLTTMSAAAWKFSRMRPAAFPTFRMARLAALIHRRKQFFRFALEAAGAEAVQDFLSVELPPFWKHHYRFGMPASAPTAVFGEAFLRVLLLNVFIPMRFFYGSYTGQQQYIDQSLLWMERLPPEDNKVLRFWKQEGLPVGSAAEGQAALHWYKHYCKPKRCLDCRIGRLLLR